MHIFLKEQKYLKDHAAKIHLIFKSPNENKPSISKPKIPFFRCISKPKIIIFVAFPNQKELCFDAYPNQKPILLAITTITRKGGCTTEYHNTPTAYIKFILQ